MPIAVSHAGTIFVSGDDGEDHCPGRTCANMYALLLRAAADSSRVESSEILAIGVNGSTAQSSLASWNLPTNGGPGLTIHYVVNATDITAVDFTRYRVLYIPSRSGQVGGGITQAELNALNMRRVDVETYLNSSGGSLMAFTLTGLTNPYGWLPIALTAIAATASHVDPTEDLRVLLPGVTSADISHSEYHTQFTGPSGYSGLKVLAVANPSGNPVMLGSDVARVSAGPTCTISPSSSIVAVVGDSLDLVVRAADPLGRALTIDGSLPDHVVATPSLPTRGPGNGMTVGLRFVPRLGDVGLQWWVLRATADDGTASFPCSVRVVVRPLDDLLRAAPRQVQLTGQSHSDTTLAQFVLLHGLGDNPRLSVTGAPPWLVAEIVSNSPQSGLLRVAALPLSLGPGSYFATLHIEADGVAARTLDVPVTLDLGEPVDLARSDIPAAILLSPRGTTIKIVLRHGDGTPVRGYSSVWIDLSGVTGLVDCGAVERTDRVRPAAPSARDGTIRFSIRGSGCPRGRALLRTLDGQSRELRLAGLDNDGNGRVAMTDFSVTGCGDMDGDGRADDRDWLLFKRHLGESCRAVNQPLAIDAFVSNVRKPIVSGDTITVCGTVTNVSESPVIVDTVLITTKNFSIGGAWSTIASNGPWLLQPGESQEFCSDYQYPTNSRHNCFSVAAKFRTRPPVLSVAGVPFWRIEIADSLRRCVVGVGTTSVIALPYDPIDRVGNWNDVELVGHRLADIESWDRDAQREVAEALDSPEADTLFYLWKAGLLRTGYTSREYTLVTHLAFFLSALEFSAPRETDGPFVVADGHVPTEVAAGTVFGPQDCVPPGCIPCHPNGCGPDPLRGTGASWANAGLNFLMPLFRDCCDWHDCCYHGVREVGGTAAFCSELGREICDRNWRECMHDVCDRLPLGLSIPCRIHADLSWAFVRWAFGNKFNYDCNRPPPHIVDDWKRKQVNTSATRRPTTPSRAPRQEAVTRRTESSEVLIPVVVDHGGEWRIEMASLLPPGAVALVRGFDASGAGTVRDSATLAVEIDPGTSEWDSGTMGHVVLVAYDAEGEYVGDAEVLVDPPDETAPPVRSGVVIGPNPMREECLIGFATQAGQPFEVEIFDLGGRAVRHLAKGTGVEAWMQVRWNGTDSRGNRLPPGIYTARIRNGSTVTSRKVITVR
jgi:hypothetical protein